MQHHYALILAGGGGTRLWPLSRKDTPKQMLPLIGDISMFKMSVQRLAPVFAPDHIYVVTGENYVTDLQAETPEIPTANFVIEPYGRDNTAAIALALATIHKRDPQAVVAMLPSDHHISKPEVFCEVLKSALQVAEQNHIVTLGISPTFPATSFGYIQQGGKLGALDGFTYYQATRFTEKPDVVRATQFLASGRYSWNSGIFIWRTEQAWAEFERQQKPTYALFQSVMSAVETPHYQETLHQIWDEAPKISIDFAIMEGAQRMVVIPVDIGWSDVGSWASLFDLLPQDKLGNCTNNPDPDKHIVLDTRHTLVYSQKLIVTIGVEELVVVDTEDVLMICHKNRTQDVKEIVQYLRQNGQTDYL